MAERGTTGLVDLEESPRNFTDPDGDSLTYTVTSSNTNAVTVSLAGTVIELFAANVGQADIQVTARDSGGLTATLTFSATVTAPPTTPMVIEVLNVRRSESSSFPRFYWSVAGTIRNMTGQTINYPSEVRIDVFDAAGILIAEDIYVFSDPVPDGGQATFDILIFKSDVVEASSYTLEVTNYIDFVDVVQPCSGCGRRDW